MFYLESFRDILHSSAYLCLLKDQELLSKTNFFFGAFFGQYTLAYFPLYGEVRLGGFGFGIQNGR